jgi:hypothetical protein
MFQLRLAVLSLTIGSVAFAGTSASAGGWDDDCPRGSYGPVGPYYTSRDYFPPPMVYYVPPRAYYPPPAVAYNYYGPAGPIRYYLAPPPFGHEVARPSYFPYYRYSHWRRW